MKKPEDIMPTFPEWPRQWMGLQEDVLYGQGLIKVMRPFVEHLIAGGLKDKTIRNHMGNLWLLGGEIIRDVSIYDEYDVPPDRKLRASVGSDGGPYCRHLDTESEMRSFDATCRKLHKFFESNI